MSAIARNLFLRTLAGLKHGYLQFTIGEVTYGFGDASSPLQAAITVHDESFFDRAVFFGDIGLGESYMDGGWSTPDLVAAMRVAVRNLEVLESRNSLLSFLGRTMNAFAHRRRDNTRSGSRRNIAYHYDLGNDFYRLFLDSNLAYSCAYFENVDDSLERAQIRKFERICRKLQLTSSDHVLDIGTGWGGFAAYAASAYGCSVTTTTISRQQYEYSQQLFAQIGKSNRIELLFEDYRNLTGRYEKIVSIEMFEAVGHRHYDDYFMVCDRLLQPDGAMLLQTITMAESKFYRYLDQSDWIQKYIFPGAELASVAEIIRALARSTRFRLHHLEEIGMHYAETLHEWRRRFHEHLAEVEQLGYGPRFIRMWDYYLAYCEGAFRERYIGDVQLLLSKTGNPRRLMNEPGPGATNEQEWSLSGL